jgi:hypothetical protein
VATGAAVWRIRPGAAEQIFNGVGSIAYNQEDLRCGIGDGPGGVEVVDESGGSNWDFSVPGTPTALTWLADRGLVVVMVDEGDMGGLGLYEPDGTEVSYITTPMAAAGVAASGDGSTLAVLLEEEVHFYDLYATGDQPKERMTLGSPTHE